MGLVEIGSPNGPGAAVVVCGRPRPRAFLSAGASDEVPFASGSLCLGTRAICVPCQEKVSLSPARSHIWTRSAKSKRSWDPEDTECALRPVSAPFSEIFQRSLVRSPAPFHLGHEPGVCLEIGNAPVPVFAHATEKRIGGRFAG